MHSIGTRLIAGESAPVARHDTAARPSAPGARRVAARAAALPGSRQHAARPATGRERAHAFHQLFQEETARRVSRWLAKLRVPRRDRSDLSQDVLLLALTRFGSYDPSRGEVARWLNGIAVNLASHYHAKASQRREVITDPVALCEAGDSATPLELLLAAERRRLLRSLVLELPFQLRLVLFQHDLHEISMRDIAETRAIPLSTVYKWRARAIHGAQETLARRLAGESEERCARRRGVSGALARPGLAPQDVA
ncbi:hypothetical protein BE11_39400 [Sorangium cellulosum]|nr:hypothetical protein BE11_39400 [Sorangium cellulosum]